MLRLPDRSARRLLLSVIVGRRVGQNLAARLHMGRFGAKLAQIDGFYGCHVCSVFSWGCRFLRGRGSGWKCFAPERSISGLRVLPMTKIAQLCFFRVINRPLNCMRMQFKGRSILPRPRAGPLAGAGECGSRNLPAGRSGSCVRKRRCFGRDRIWIFV